MIVSPSTTAAKTDDTGKPKGDKDNKNVQPPKAPKEGLNNELLDSKKNPPTTHPRKDFDKKMVAENVDCLVLRNNQFAPLAKDTQYKEMKNSSSKGSHTKRVKNRTLESNNKKFASVKLKIKQNTDTRKT